MLVWTSDHGDHLPATGFSTAGGEKTKEAEIGAQGENEGPQAKPYPLNSAHPISADGALDRIHFHHRHRRPDHHYCHHHRRRNPEYLHIYLKLAPTPIPLNAYYRLKRTNFSRTTVVKYWSHPTRYIKG